MSDEKKVKKEELIEADMEKKTEPENEGQEAACSVKVDELEVEKTIRGNVYASIGTGIIPLPFIDFAALTALHLNLARQLSGLYGVEFNEGMAKNIIVSATGAVAPLLASPFVRTAVIGIPLIGLPLAVGTRPLVNGMCTYAIGQMFITHFKRGGNFLSANADEMKEDFSSAFKNSREKVGNMIAGKKVVTE